MPLRSLAVVLLASIPASPLLAQDAAPRSAETAGRAETRTAVRVERGGSPDARSVEFDMQNGKPSRLVVDGEELPLDRLRETPDGFEVLDADGKVIERIMARVGGAAVASGSAGGSRMGRASARAGGEKGLVVVEGQPLDEKTLRALAAVARGDADAPAPKSMIGAGLGSVGGALAHHLGLDAERASKATMLTGVVKDLPAAAAGLERFDVIVSVNGSDDASRAALGEVLRAAEPGSEITLGVRRGGETKSREVTVVAFDRAKLAEMEPIAAEGFDLDAFGMGDVDMDSAGGVGGFAIPPMRARRGAAGAGGEGMEVDVEIDVDGEFDGVFDGDAMGFFVGPDGERHEFRMGLPAGPRGADAAQIDALRQLMREFERRMEAMNERMQNGPRAGEREGGPGTPRDEVRRDEARRDEVRRDEVRREAESNERLRRLEERLDAVMRELERANAERRGR